MRIWRRPENRVAVVVAVVAIVAGAITMATLSGSAQIIASTVLFGLAGIAVVSLVFLLVGESEEDDRRRHPRG